MQPVKVTVNGTGSCTPIFPDICQNPFNILCVVSQNVATATYSIEYMQDFSTAMSPRWNGTTATWIPHSGVNLATASFTTGNFQFPVAAIRLTVATSAATSVVTMNLIQSVNAP